MNQLSRLPHNFGVNFRRKLLSFLGCLISLLLLSFILPLNYVQAEFACPDGMSDLDCAALYGPWVDWVPETTLAQCLGAEGATTLVGSDNQQKAFNYFISKGLTPEQSAGILGNLIQESRLNPAIVQGGGTAELPTPGVGFGIAQWTPASRQQGLVKLASQQGVKPNTLAVQLDYIWFEGTSVAPYDGTMKAMRQTRTVADAAITFHQVFERSADTLSMIQERVDSAKQVLKLYGASTLPAAGGLSSLNPCGASEEFTVATYNLLNAENHTAKSKDLGGCNANPVSGDPTCGKTRAAIQADIITGQAGNPAFDIIGTQETSPDQYRALLNELPNYDGVPSSDSDINRLWPQQNGAVSVIWNTAKFTKFAEGKTAAITNVANSDKNPGGTIRSPWVGLRSQNGQEIYVTSIHYPNAHFFDPKLGDDGTIRRASRLTMDWVKSMKAKHPDSMVLVMGDFNDRPGTGLSYCIYTQDGIMQNTYDLAKGLSADKPCPSMKDSGKRGFGIDQIYVTPADLLTASNWTHMSRSNNLVDRASDHEPVYVNLTLNVPTSTFGKGTGKFTTSNAKQYDGVQKMLRRADLISKPNSKLAARICDGNCLGLCDRLAGGAWGYANSGYASAAVHWQAMKAGGYAHPGDRNPPVGALLFYDNAGPYGHVAVYLGDNMVLSNDVLDSTSGRTGGAYITDASKLESGPWSLGYLGWSDPIFTGAKL